MTADTTSTLRPSGESGRNGFVGMNAGNRHWRSLTIHGIQRRFREAKNKLPICRRDLALDTIGRDSSRAVRPNGLHVNPGLMPRLHAGEGDAFAIGQEAGIIMINRIVRDLLWLPGTRGTRKN